MFKKVALITKETPSDWKSCQLITSNLLKAYQPLFHEKNILQVGVEADLNSFKAFKLAEKLKNEKVDLIIWLEHRPNFTKIIKALDLAYEELLFHERPKIIVHVFGDFVLDSADWLQSLNYLKNWPLYIFTASDRQQKLLNSFFNKNLLEVGVIPFPVNESVFSMNDFVNDREQIRNIYQTKKETQVFLYTGRISYQKNIESLIKNFISIETIVDDIELWIAGSFDDLLFPYAGKHGVVGSYYSYLKSRKINFSHPKIKFLGNLNSSELAKTYHAADCFISFSTHNDEDYGMSPAEALMCGMPCLLSNWGGYSSFEKISREVKLVKISFGRMRPVIDSKFARNSMLEFLLKKPLTIIERQEISKSANEKISISSTSEMLSTKIKALEFGSFAIASTLFEQVAKRFINTKRQPFKSEEIEYELDDLYLKTYEVYCE